MVKSLGRSRRVSGSGTAILPWGPRSTRRAKKAPRSAPEGRIGLQDGPRAFQDAQDGPKTAREAPKTTQEGSKRIPQKAPRAETSMFPVCCFTGCILGFFLFPTIKNKSRGPKDRSRRLQRPSRELQERLRGPQECPRGPEMAQDGPKSARKHTGGKNMATSEYNRSPLRGHFGSHTNMATFLL